MLCGGLGPFNDCRPGDLGGGGGGGGFRAVWMVNGLLWGCSIPGTPKVGNFLKVFRYLKRLRHSFGSAGF